MTGDAQAVARDLARRACPACSGAASRSLGRTGQYTWSRCGACGTRFVVEPVDQAELDDFYAGYYSGCNPAVPQVVEERLDELVRSFVGYRSTGRLLDVGFGAGSLLEAASRSGWECWGTELAASDAEQTRPSWNIHRGDLKQLSLPLRAFDVVCMVELLEHVLDPVEQLGAAARLLRPGGLLFATTPSAGGLSAKALGLRWSAFAPPEHLQLFTPSSLRRATASAGYSRSRVLTTGTNPRELAAGLRRRRLEPDERVEAGYRLNERLHGSARGRVLRTAANAALRATSLGDSLKLYAVRS